MLKSFYTKDKVYLDTVKWVKRKAVVFGEDGNPIFEQDDVEVPEFWSQTALNITASKYLYGAAGTDARETSIGQLVKRVVDTITEWGKKDGYFPNDEEADVFGGELGFMLLHQILCFNSPVLFNVGVEDEPQCSACFINSVEDTMESILELAKTEGMIFRFGSGTGTNLSTLRSSVEPLTSGGIASGPVSFLKGYDAFAGVIKSGGKTRRAAKMNILNVSHPDIMDFVGCKANEEKKAQALIAAGYGGNVGGEAYESVAFQNVNTTVRLTDAFMQACVNDEEWETLRVVDGGVAAKYKATEVMEWIAECAWRCGDPGVQFDDTINLWNTCEASGRIESSNPCSEYMFLDNSACNLSSINLLKFMLGDGHFDIEAFRHVVDVAVVAMDIIVDNALYPTEKIAENSSYYRPLGLGYTNLGALLMASGIPYDSDEGRTYSAAITSLMTAQAYRCSAKLAKLKGACAGYNGNEKSFGKVVKRHADANRALVDESDTAVAAPIIECVEGIWDEGLLNSAFRNSQLTLLAPTGTISFLMDCYTTGIEPDLALVKYKSMSDGGKMKLVNGTVESALRALGYPDDVVTDVVKHVAETGVVDPTHISPQHISVFDCAFEPEGGGRSIDRMGHLKMMEAVQPFLSGSISKTVNMPSSSTVEDVVSVYVEAWKMGLKSVAIYRDGCKKAQPLSTKGALEVVDEPTRSRLPDEREAIVHKFSIGGHEGYVTLGKFPNGDPGEIFVTMAKQGSTISGLVDTVATLTSIALQYGVPLKVLIDKFSHARFEPYGHTPNPDIRIASSVVDYIFRWLGTKFPKDNGRNCEGNECEDGKVLVRGNSNVNMSLDAPPCYACGSIMGRSGTCFRCDNCGSTTGCS